MSELTKLKHEFANSSGFLIALGDQKRQNIIIALMEPKIILRGLQVTDLIDVTGLSRPAVSHHLKILKDASIVDYRREGTKNFYYLSHKNTELNKLRALLDHTAEVIKCNREI
ncbi:ArsR/SmtB family transcription factor [Companilactobacillus insicii]|uniref:ArsR/SmtB family transcription factor n=1 Tax=Companilactobacillus insicii TaxID=1732567 RepID=UPI000F786CD4|nr:metalloregulator ArsR/SmtB family transcription factor [Companilactobacillus insicii]